MRKALIGLAAIAVAIPALPSAAVAQRYDRGDRYEQSYRGDRQNYRDDRRDYRGDRRDQRRYARYYDRGGRYSGPTWRGRDGRSYCHRSDGTTGLLIGGVAGALVGRSVDTRGDRAAGTLLGAVAGALLGNAIDRDNGGRRCR